LGTKISEDHFRIIIQVAKEKKPKTVEQLADLLKEKLPKVAEEDVMEAILQLQAEGKIYLEKSRKPVSKELGSYAKSNQALWYWMTTNQALWYWMTIIGASLSTLAVAIPEEFYPWVLIRQSMGALLVLWFPGYSLIKALLPNYRLFKSSSETVNRIARICLSLCMSLAVVSIIGFILNYTSWGVRLNSVTLSLYGFTVLLSTVAVLREHQAKLQLT
jgi:hypothetical protein